ncbi:uncharacterized protein FTOL_13978 [Fusarium torulosum]|uniref:Uncharacterized protein n=1 Tax=Fusarium torulosum TaxID=33205 RepID=A0AAE8MN44_9HYPO|nr:uncharacterized protein FTOL_13978 [Fusarium torulosum]
MSGYSSKYKDIILKE